MSSHLVWTAISLLSCSSWLALMLMMSVSTYYSKYPTVNVMVAGSRATKHLIWACAFVW